MVEENVVKAALQLGVRIFELEKHPGHPSQKVHGGGGGAPKLKPSPTVGAGKGKGPSAGTERHAAAAKKHGFKANPAGGHSKKVGMREAHVRMRRDGGATTSYTHGGQALPGSKHNSPEAAFQVAGNWLKA